MWRLIAAIPIILGFVGMLVLGSFLPNNGTGIVIGLAIGLPVGMITMCISIWLSDRLKNEP